MAFLAIREKIMYTYKQYVCWCNTDFLIKELSSKYKYESVMITLDVEVNNTDDKFQKVHLTRKNNFYGANICQKEIFEGRKIKDDSI